jgi:putative ABC transport system permease protein
MVVYRRIARGLKRKPVMALGVALVVGLSIGGFLIFSQIASSIQANVSSAQSAVKNIIEVQSATPVPEEQVNEPMTAPNLVNQLSSVAGVVAVQRMSYVNFQGGAISTNGPLPLEGVDLVAGGTTLNVIGNGQAGPAPYTITQGRDLQVSDASRSVAVVPAVYASNNGIEVGSTINENGTSFTVVGYYSTGNQYADAGGPAIVPYDPGLQASHASGPNAIYVTVESSSSVFSTVGQIQSLLGSGYEVQPVSDLGGVANDIDSIASTNSLEEYVALAIGACVIGLVTFLATAQRRREIGLLKALGFTDFSVVGQLTLESLLWSLLGLPIAFAFSLIAGPAVLQSIQNATNAGGSGTINGQSVSSASSFLSATFSLSPEVILLGVALCVGIGLAGSAIPILRAVRLRPSEAMRHVGN